MSRPMGYCPKHGEWLLSYSGRCPGCYSASRSDDPIHGIRPYLAFLQTAQAEVDAVKRPGSVTQTAMAIALGNALGQDEKFQQAVLEDWLYFRATVAMAKEECGDD